ncbi:MAG: Ig-like domain-containing protein [Candidatus Nitrosopolaris sp.]
MKKSVSFFIVTVFMFMAFGELSQVNPHKAKAISNSKNQVSISSSATPPTVSSTTPANGATGVPVNSAVTIIFSKQMQSSTITWQNISFTDASFNSVDRAVSLAADNVTCTVTPVAALTAGTQYIVTVSTGVQDLAGNSMASQYSFSFTAA